MKTQIQSPGESSVINRGLLSMLLAVVFMLKKVVGSCFSVWCALYNIFVKGSTLLHKRWTLALSLGFWMSFQLVAQAAVMTCVPDPGFTECRIFTNEGADQPFSVPAGIGKVYVKLWGAGGGGGTGSTGLGGGGALVKGLLTVTTAATATNITVVVGSGGKAVTTTTTYGGGGAGGNDTSISGLNGGSGGGRSAIRIGTTEHMTAGGGGGAAGFTDFSSFGTESFAGGGGQSAAWTEGCIAGTAATTGSTTTGGTRGGGSAAQLGTNGASLTGGAGGSANAISTGGGGGGGGGFFGGGGGAGQSATAACTASGTDAANGQDGAGAGGSSNALASTVANAVITNGNSQNTAGTSDTHYTSGVGVGASSAGNGGNGQVVIQWGPPKVTIMKISEGGVGTFTFSGNNGIPSQSITTTTSNVAASGGTVILTASGVATTITENTLPATMGLKSIACTGVPAGSAAVNLATRTVTLSAAATVASADIVCTFTNATNPKITIRKISEREIGTFTFSGSNGIPNQSITTTEPAVAVNGETVILTAPGVATTITESNHSTMALKSATCTGMGSGGTATLGTGASANTLTLNAAATTLGADIVCTFTNTPLPLLTIVKRSESGVGTFSFTVTNGSTTIPPQNITTTLPSKPERTMPIGLAAVGATTTITEAAPSGGNELDLSDIFCTGLGSGSATINLINRSVSLNSAAIVLGARIVCTFTNGPLPKITISKISEGGVGTFSFTGNNGFSAQSLTTTTPGMAINGTTQPLTITATTSNTVITEAVPPAPFLFKDVRCDNLTPNGTATVNKTNRTVTLNTIATAFDSNTHCTFINAIPATLTLAKVSHGGVGSFSFTGTNGITAQSLTTTAADVAVMGSPMTLTASSQFGGTVITEAIPPAPFLFQGASCTGMGPGGTATVNTTNRTITLDAAATALGSNIVCTTINAPLPTLTVAKISEGGTGTFTFTANPSTGNGFSTQTLTTTTPDAAVMGTPQTLTKAFTSTTFVEGAPTAPLLFKNAECTGMGAGGTATVTPATRTIVLNAAATAPGANIVCTVTNAPSVVELAVNMTVASTPTRMGDAADYVISVKNVGSATSSGTYSFIDTIPAGVTVTGLTAGTGWACARTPNQAFPYVSDGTAEISCNRSTALAAGATSTMVTITTRHYVTGPTTNTTVLTSVSADTTCDGINEAGRCSSSVTTAEFPAQPSFGTCDDRVFLSQNDPTTAYRIDMNDSPFSFVALGPPESALPPWNATAFNPVDNYLYALPSGSNPPLYRVGADGSIVNMGPITGWPVGGSDAAAGEFGPDGKYYVRNNSGNTTHLITIDIPTRTATYMTLSPSIGRTSDLAYHQGKLYARITSGESNGDRLVSIDPTTAAVTFIGPAIAPPASQGSFYAFGAMIGTPTGVYGGSNGGQGFFSFNLTNGAMTRVSSIPPTGTNDAAHCGLAPLSLRADLEITKTDNKTQFSPGRSNTYTLSVTNSGPFGVTGIQVSDPFPAGITSGSWTCETIIGEGDASCGAASGTGALNDVVALSVGAVLEYKVRLDVPSTFTGNLVNTAMVTPSSDVNDFDRSNNTATDIDEPLPTVTISKISQGGVDSFAFSGTNGITDQIITTTVDGTAVNGEMQALTTPDVATTITESAIPEGYILSDISCTGLGAGGTATPNLSGSSVSLDAAATALGAKIVCTFINTKLPVLSLVKSLPSGRAISTDQFTLSIAAPSLATPVTATTTGSTNSPTEVALLSAGLVGEVYTLSEVATGATLMSAYNINYICTNTRVGGQTPSGKSTSFSITAEAGDELSCAFINTVKADDLSIVKTVSPNTAVPVGGLVTYILKVDNHATVLDANGAVLRDNPGDGLDCTAADLIEPTCSASGNAVCPTGLTNAGLISNNGVVIPTLPAGGGISITIQCRVTASGQ